MVIIKVLLNPAKLFLLFTIVSAILVNINLYQAKYIQPTFKELAKYNLYLIAVYWVINMMVTFGMSIGINHYKLPVWAVTIIYWGSAIIPTLIMAYIWFGQLPTVRELIGVALVILGIVLVSIK